MKPLTHQNKAVKTLLKLMPLAIVLLVPGFVKAQVAITNQGILYQASGTDTLYINGSMDNQNSAAFTNNGQFHLKGNLNNDENNMAIGTGRLLLNGSSAQTISGSKQFNTYNLTTANSAGVTINNDLSVNNSHTFTNGIITTGNNDYLIYQSGATYSGDGNTKHVNGTVKKIGSQDFDFPIGNGTYERKAGIRNLTTSSEFNGTYSNTVPNTHQKRGRLASISPNEYWDIHRVSGGNAKVSLTWDASKVALNIGTSFLNYLNVIHYTNSAWGSETSTRTGSLLTSGSITSGTLESFSPFGFGSDGGVLPVTVQNLAVSCLGNKDYNLSWLANQDEGKGVYKISYINSNGIATDISQLMPQVGNEINYKTKVTLPEAIDKPVFMLQYIDVENGVTDLGSVYADCLASDNINSSMDDDNISLINSADNLALKFETAGNSDASTYVLEIYNAAGQLVKPAEDIEIMGGGSSQIVPMEIPFVAQGMYFAVLTNSTNKKKKTFKVIH